LLESFSFQNLGYYEINACVGIGSPPVLDVATGQYNVVNVLNVCVKICRGNNNNCNTENLCLSELNLSYVQGSVSATPVTGGYIIGYLDTCSNVVVYANKNDEIQVLFSYNTALGYRTGLETLTWQDSIFHLANSTIALTNANGQTIDYSSVWSFNGYCQESGC
jgi:hypothetical protein